MEELKKKRILFVAGGVGTATVYPQVKWLHEHGVTADAIIGAKTKDLVILEQEFEEVCNLYVTTDDGSYKRKGMVTQNIQDLVEEGKHWLLYTSSKKRNRIFAAYCIIIGIISVVGYLK